MSFTHNRRKLRAAAANARAMTNEARRVTKIFLDRKAPEVKTAAVKGAVRTIGVMDRVIDFMTQRHYRSPNPAIAMARGPIVWGCWILVALAVVMIGWGALAPIDSAVVARGSIVLSSNRKTVQHLEGGIINEIFVKDGDKVVAGQKLMTLTNQSADSTRDTVREQLYDAQAAEARLIALREGRDAVTFDAELVAAAKTSPVVAKILATQTDLFTSEKQAEDAKLASLKQRVEQSNADITGLRAQRDSAGEQRRLVEEEIKTVEDLLKKGYATKPRLYALQKSQSELIGSDGQLDAQIEKASQTINQIQSELDSEKNAFQAKIGQELGAAQAKVADLGDRLRASDDVVGRTTIKAPASGVVMGLKYHTTGGVVAAGGPLMDIVPQDDPLVAEARVSPNDISHLHEGLEANVMFTSYKARRTPKVPAKVVQVSADTFVDERTNAPYYKARLEIDKEFMNTLRHPVELYPGSPVNVFITTGSRSFLTYLFQPLSDGMQQAFREE